MRQSLKRFQLIIVDNGNNFDYTTIFEDAHMSELFLSKLKILQSGSSNIFEMCNEGLRIAQGKYVVFANGYDLFLGNFLETLYSLAEQNHAEIVYPYNYGVPIGDNNIRANSDEKAWEFEEANHELNDKNLSSRLQGFLNGIFYPRIFNKLIRRDFLVNNNITFSTDANIPEWIFCLKCLCLAEKYMRIPEVLYVQLLSGNFESEVDPYRTIAAVKDLEKFMDSMNFFNDKIEVRKAILSNVLKKGFFT